jgi:hypothetical protein
VNQFGGFKKVCETRSWQKVRKKLNIPHSSSSGNNLIRIWKLYFGDVDHKPFLLSKRKRMQLSKDHRKEQRQKSSTSKQFERIPPKKSKSLGTAEKLKELIKRYKQLKTNETSTSSSFSLSSSSLNMDNLLQDPFFFWEKTNLESFQNISPDDIVYLRNTIGYKDQLDMNTALGKCYSEKWNDIDFLNAFQENHYIEDDDHINEYFKSLEDPRVNTNNIMPRLEELWVPSTPSSSSSSSSSTSLLPLLEKGENYCGDSGMRDDSNSTSNSDEDEEEEEEENIEKTLINLQESLQTNRKRSIDQIVRLGGVIVKESSAMLVDEDDNRNQTASSTTKLLYTKDELNHLSSNIQVMLTPETLNNLERPIVNDDDGCNDITAATTTTTTIATTSRTSITTAAAAAELSLPVAAASKKKRKLHDGRCTSYNSKNLIMKNALVLLMDGYHVKKKYIGKYGLISNGIELKGGWYEICILDHLHGKKTGEKIMWRKSSLKIQKKK